MHEVRLLHVGVPGLRVGKREGAVARGKIVIAEAVLSGDLALDDR